jgi:hypothetical protein
MSFRDLILPLLLLAIAIPACAAPTIDLIANQGVWEVWVTPDVETFVSNSSLEVELDIGVYGELVDATLNTDFWNVNGESPGNNPFTGEVTSGLVFDPSGQGAYRGTIFVAAGSELFASPEPARVLSFDTTILTWAISIGGRTVLPGTDKEYLSARIAQNGINYDGIELERVFCRDGDFDCNGSIGNNDLTLLLDSWGEQFPPFPPGWIGPPPPPAGSFGNTQLTALLDNWGDVYGEGAGAQLQLVPEPATLLLAAVLLIIPVAHRRRQP